MRHGIGLVVIYMSINDWNLFLGLSVVKGVDLIFFIYYITDTQYGTFTHIGSCSWMGSYSLCGIGCSSILRLSDLQQD